MIELFVKNGAKLSSTLKPSEIGMYLCNCVKNNQLDRLRAWHCAGADLDQADYDGRTPLLMVNRSKDLLDARKTFCSQAVNYNSLDCVRYLLEYGDVDINWVDSRGLTPVQLAKQRGYDSILQLLSAYADN